MANDAGICGGEVFQISSLVRWESLGEPFVVDYKEDYNGSRPTAGNTTGGLLLGSR